MLSFPNKNKGFSIIEGTLAIAVLIIGLMAIMQVFPFGLKVIGDSQNTTIASSVALEKIEELRSVQYDSLATGTIEAKHHLSADAGNYLYSYQRQTIVELVDANFNQSGTDIGLKKITVTVFWVSPVGFAEKSIQLNSIVAKTAD
ncbi:MAG: hypothetical protein WC768_03980 [Patescibacteria group bacterium]|jgi:type II secretory pathway pseudopilin PulG